MPSRCNSYRAYLTGRFGGPVRSVPVNGGFSCPNRDGGLSASGCTFCDNRSFSPVARSDGAHALEELRSAIRRGGRRFKSFIAYLQPFSNTYAPVDRLASVYEPLIAEHGVVGLSIGTRPDCLGDDVLAYLQDINPRTWLTVEIGLQSGNDPTLARLNRGHTAADFERAVRVLDKLQIYSTAHVMLGLPGEDRERMIATARFCAGLPVKGIKIHQLMVIAGTALESEYRTGAVGTLDIEEYCAMLGEFLENLRPDQHIHRLMADSRPENGLIAPLWSAEKSTSMKKIQEYFETADVRQGRQYAHK